MLWTVAALASEISEMDDDLASHQEVGLGTIAGAELVLVERLHCPGIGSCGIEVEARWGGVTSPLFEAWNISVRDARLEGDQLVLDLWNAVEHGDSVRSVRRASLDPATHRVSPAEEVFRQTESEALRADLERLSAEDRIVAIELLADEPGATSVLVRAVRDAALADRAAGRPADGADRILALFARGRHTAGDTTIEVEGAGAIRVELDHAGVELVNDLGFLLDEGGASAAAAQVLAVLVDERPERTVALLNYADALWHLGRSDAGSWYRRYVKQAERPAKWAKQRAGANPPAPAPRGDAEARFVAALAAGDLERALGAAVAGGFAAESRGEWWTTGVRLLQERVARGAPQIWRARKYLGPIPPGGVDPEHLAALREPALALAFIEGADVVELLDPAAEVDLALARARARSGGTYDDLAKVAETDLVVGLGQVEDDVCALLYTRFGTLEARCSGGRKVRPDVLRERRPPAPACFGDEWPCFEALTWSGSLRCAERECTADVPPTGTGHACGIDRTGQVRCQGTDLLASLAPPAGRGFLTVASSADHACALRDDHSAHCWGRNDLGQAPPRIERVVDLVTTSRATCVLTLDGTVECLGKGPVLPALPPRPAFLTPDDYAGKLAL